MNTTAIEKVDPQPGNSQVGVSLPVISQLWDQQAGESGKAFHAFQQYRDLDPRSRTFKAVQDILYPESPYAGKTLRRWAERFHWIERVSAWERSLDQERLRVQIKTIKSMAQRHIDEAILLQDKGQAVLNKLTDKELDEITVADARLLITEGAKLERLARGQSTEKYEQTSRGGLPDELSQLPEEELRRLADLAASIATGASQKKPD